MFLQHDLMVQGQSFTIHVIIHLRTSSFYATLERKKKLSFCVYLAALYHQQSANTAWYVTWDSMSVCLHTSATFIHAFMDNHTPLICILHVKYEHLHWNPKILGFILIAPNFKAHSGPLHQHHHHHHGHRHPSLF